VTASTGSGSQGNNNDMGLHLYVPDDQERGTDWNCSVEEMLRYATGAEQQQVFALAFI